MGCSQLVFAVNFMETAMTHLEVASSVQMAFVTAAATMRAAATSAAEEPGSCFEFAFGVLC